MLSALLDDLFRAGVETTTLLHPSLPSDGFSARRVVRSAEMFSRVVEREMAAHDAVWIIAPETGGSLLQLTRLAESLKKKIFGAGSRAVDVFGDKLKTYETLKGLATMPHTSAFTGTYDRFPCVVKPADGAGCESTYLVSRRDELRELELPDTRFIIQPFIAGEPMSAAFVSRANDTALLGVARQKIATNGRLRFEGVEGPVEYPNAATIEMMAEAVRNKVPELFGYWGMDFVETHGGPVLIEVNPRLTSSYPLYIATAPFNIPLYVIGGA